MIHAQTPSVQERSKSEHNHQTSRKTTMLPRLSVLLGANRRSVQTRCHAGAAQLLRKRTQCRKMNKFRLWENKKFSWPSAGCLHGFHLACVNLVQEALPGACYNCYCRGWLVLQQVCYGPVIFLVALISLSLTDRLERQINRMPQLWSTLCWVKSVHGRWFGVSIVIPSPPLSGFEPESVQRRISSGIAGWLRNLSRMIRLERNKHAICSLIRTWQDF